MEVLVPEMPEGSVVEALGLVELAAAVPLYPQAQAIAEWEL